MTTDLMHHHVSPDTARRGECHGTAGTLVPLLPVVALQVVVEAAPADEGLTALETDVRPLPCVGPD